MLSQWQQEEAGAAAAVSDEEMQGIVEPSGTAEAAAYADMYTAAPPPEHGECGGEL
jgi:hypothetical protein